MNNWRHPVFSLGEDFPMFELKYDWSRRFQFEFEWIELTIVDNKLGWNGQLAGDWEGKVGGRIRSRPSRQSQITKTFCKDIFCNFRSHILINLNHSETNFPVKERFQCNTLEKKISVTLKDKYIHHFQISNVEIILFLLFCSL